MKSNMSKITNSFDIDGVITVGLYPGPNDVLITGRSYEEAPETYAMLRSKGIHNAVFFNKLPFDKKGRKSSGTHKGYTIKELIQAGVNIKVHFEDDEVQKAEIGRVLDCYGIKGVTVVHIVHDLTEKENVRNPWPQEPFDASGKLSALAVEILTKNGTALQPGE